FREGQISASSILENADGLDSCSFLSKLVPKSSIHVDPLHPFSTQAGRYTPFELVARSLCPAPEGIEGDSQDFGQPLALVDLGAFFFAIVLDYQLTGIGRELR